MNRLYYGDNLDVLRRHIADDSVDLIYLDPPFNSNADYNAILRTPKGEASAAQMEAFTDTWQWDDAVSGEAVNAVKRSRHQDAARMLDAMLGFLGKNALTAYLAMMAVRLVELHRVLKPTGSLYLHCDPTASHYLKILLDGVFGARGFRSEIIWKRSSSHNDTKQGLVNYGHIHDAIFFYSKGKKWKWNSQFTEYMEEYTGRDYRLVDEGTGRRFRRGDLTAAKGGGDTSYEWRVAKRLGIRERWQADLNEEYKNPKEGWEYKGVWPYTGRFWAYSRDNMCLMAKEGRLRHTFEGMPEYKRYLDEMPGVALQDIWTDIRPLLAHERLGYPTEKPVSLLERIVSVSSNPGDVVLDPFCGCGTTVHAAQKLGRQWIGIDITHLAVGLIEKRLNDAFPGVQYSVHGTPMDVDGARDLFNRDDRSKKQFETWACLRIGFIPQEKKGADGGLDGVEWFGPKKEYKAIVSVKGGKAVGVDMLRSLDAVVAQQGAKVGVFLTLEPPTAKMVEWAKQAGLFEAPGFAPVPRIQIVTVEQAIALRERAVNLPARHNDTFKKAPREVDRGAQGALDL